MITEIAKNKKAYFDYEILETYEAGIVLSGSEIKAVRAKNVNLAGSYVKILQGKAKKPEIWAININIKNPIDPTRTRKLLLSKHEIVSLIGKSEQKKLTIVPLKLYIKNKKWAKLLIGLSRGRKQYDKRAVLKERDQKRESQKMMKEY